MPLMALVACLIAAEQARPLDRALVQEAGRALQGEVRWLSPDEAVEIPTGLSAAEALHRLDQIVGEAQIDRAVVPAEGRRKRLLVSDMDSTLITVECIDELADYAGIKPQIAEVTRRAMNGEIEFRQALIDRVGLLADLPLAAIDEICRERVRVMPGAVQLVRTMRAAGARCVLVSGGFKQFTGPVRQMIGLDLDEGNQLEVSDGRLTGRLAGEILDAQSKLATLRRQAVELRIGTEDVVAVGDGANDLPMLLAAGMGVAFHAHPRVQRAAPVNVRHADLTALLFLQGYRRDEFATLSSP
jgi:phosphoserine phosphatase